MEKIYSKIFLTYKLSVIAQKKGFDEECIAWWEKPYEHKSKKIIEKFVINGNEPVVLSLESQKLKEDRPGMFAIQKNKNSTTPAWTVTCPSYEQIIEWFVQKHNLNIVIFCNDTANMKFFNYHIWHSNVKNNSAELYSENRKTKTSRFKALQLAIKEAFKLIKNEKL